MNATPSKRIRVGIVAGAVIAIGLFLSIAAHALDWSGATPFVVASALVFVLAACGTPLILLPQLRDATERAHQDLVHNKNVVLKDTTIKPAELNVEKIETSMVRFNPDRERLIVEPTRRQFALRLDAAQEPDSVSYPDLHEALGDANDGDELDRLPYRRFAFSTH